MNRIRVQSLGEDENEDFFGSVRSLPGRDFWGKKSRFLRGDFKKFQEFLDYIKPFDFRCFLVAKEAKRFVGFAVAIYNPSWTDELKERYGYDVEKRAYILGIAVVQKREDVLSVLVDELTDYFSRKKIRGIEYPTLGNVCLTTGTDILTSENVDALLVFRQAGFKISECYYSMKLNLKSYIQTRKYQIEAGSFCFEERSIGIVQKNETIAKITWNPIVEGKTDIDIHVNLVYRGKGLGKALMAKALQKLKADGVNTVELGVDGNNVPALKLYRKFGFVVSRTHFYVLRTSNP